MYDIGDGRLAYFLARYIAYRIIFKSVMFESREIHNQQLFCPRLEITAVTRILSCILALSLCCKRTISNYEEPARGHFMHARRLYHPKTNPQSTTTVQGLPCTLASALLPSNFVTKRSLSTILFSNLGNYEGNATRFVEMWTLR